MVPAYLFLVSVAVFRGLGNTGVAFFSAWTAACRWGLTLMLVFTGITHFSGMDEDYMAMIPFEALPQPWIVFATGLLEIAGAIGIQIRCLRVPAATGLMLLLVVLLPANVYAALNEIPFRNQPPTPWPLSVTVQLLFLSVTWWSCLSRPISSERPV